MSTILIVDDNPENISILSDLLLPQYTVRATNSGKRALQIAKSDPVPDLILLDVMMPEINGYEVLKQLKLDEQTVDIPVIFVTALESSIDEEQGFWLGAVDYITKPINPAIVMARVKTHLELKSAREWLKNQNSLLESEVAKQMEENHFIQEASIRALACLAETRDPETGNHLRRTQQYVALLCEQLKEHPRFKDFLTEQNTRTLIISTPLHDIGKVGIPDSILLKPDKLTPDEWNIMKKHARYGYEAIMMAEKETEKPIAFLNMAKDITLYHHEKWDGSGYPQGLAGNKIPISARLMALADVFDALITSRVYKLAFSFEQTISIIKEGRGYHFDPNVVDAFLAIKNEFYKISLLYADNSELINTKKSNKIELKNISYLP